ncbi:hypothetical protein F5148DRAFT_1197236 [Russula earlei]|uniref:Uncharacterized protein n=1 Tax=Russula earlei TaxID=71964 RepID=A0ACC0U9H8_9AGAM|nr:hypothetical protein F5148DRAFT_1197236 [Russula earlei]
MAKPDFASPPLRTSLFPPSYRVNRVPRSRPRPSLPGILATFATISASLLSAHGYPVESPLPFLYPLSVLEPTRSISKRSPASSPSDPGASTTPPDGLWHKTGWSLYGSTYRPGRCTPPSPAADVAYEGIGNPAGAQPTDYDFPPSDDFNTATLPTGWNTLYNDASSRHGTVVIIVLSVALAIIIVMMMFTCVFWRRKLALKRDPEKKERAASDIADDDSHSSIREAKAAQRRWSKAVIRWRDNIRSSARRRRTNRTLGSSTSSTILFQEERQENNPTLEGSLSHPQSRSSSPTFSQQSLILTHPDVHTPSMASLHAAHSQAQTSQALSPQALPSDTSSLKPPLSSSLPTQPPAYHVQHVPSSPSPPPDASPEYTYADCGGSGPSKAPLSLRSQFQPHCGDNSHLTSLSGHVATDDKTILSLRAALASAPPVSNTHSLQSASVPSMEDEDVSALLSESRPSSPSDAHDYEPHPPYTPPRFLLPPPPSKGKQKFDYSHELDIGENFDLTVEPGLSPSAPPCEESVGVPSAPPPDFDVHSCTGNATTLRIRRLGFYYLHVEDGCTRNDGHG